MSKSRSKGYIYGTPYIIRGGWGVKNYRHTRSLWDPLEERNSATTRAAQRRARNLPAQRAVTFMQHCNHNATSIPVPRPPAREAGRRASAKREHMERIAGAARCDIFATVYPQSNSRAAAHNLCANLRTIYTRTTQARLRQYVTLTYRDPLISIRGS